MGREKEGGDRQLDGERCDLQACTAGPGRWCWPAGHPLGPAPSTSPQLAAVSHSGLCGGPDARRHICDLNKLNRQTLDFVELGTGLFSPKPSALECQEDGAHAVRGMGGSAGRDHSHGVRVGRQEPWQRN